jgi:hypothetical protein
MGVEGEHQHEHEAPQIITPVVETESQLTAPLIDHEGKITRIEERQAQHQEEMIRQLAGLEERLVTATGSQVGALEHRIAALEGRIEEGAQQTAEIPGEGIELTLPDMDPSPAPPEKIRQGMTHRRKAKRKAGKS